MPRRKESSDDDDSIIDITGDLQVSDGEDDSDIQVLDNYQPSSTAKRSRSKVRASSAPIQVDVPESIIATTPETNPQISTDDCCWKIVLLADHREFNHTPVLKFVKQAIDAHFHGTHPSLDGHRSGSKRGKYPLYCERTTLPSADYMFVARHVHIDTGKVREERVLNCIIERKHVNDLQRCLIKPSKKYKPLTFFEAQMYKLRECVDLSKKIFLMEGDEDNDANFYKLNKHGTHSKFEHQGRLKRVKTLRLHVLKGEYEGVDLVCTRTKHDSVQYIVDQMEALQESFNPDPHNGNLPDLTMKTLTECMNDRMKAPTFLEYLRLRSLKRVGNITAMKRIMDPDSVWNKAFRSPDCTDKLTKASLEDRAIYYEPQYRDRQGQGHDASTANRRRRQQQQQCSASSSASASSSSSSSSPNDATSSSRNNTTTMNKRRKKKNSTTTVATTAAATTNATTTNATTNHATYNITTSANKNKATIPPPRRRLEEVSREKANTRAKVSRYNPLHDRGASLAVSIASSLGNEFELYGYGEKEQGCEFERMRQRQRQQDELPTKASAKKEKKDNKKRRTSNDGNSGNSSIAGDDAGGRTPTSATLTTTRRNHNVTSTLELSPAKSYSDMRRKSALLAAAAAAAENRHRQPPPRRPTPSSPVRTEDDVAGSTNATGWECARCTYINENMCYLVCGLCNEERP
mmetsp:Transcript_28319/g.43393  ORF Transcript_28319/g.43393 Transcript_28319/m.43393 type:complete len:690 (+) Transcript_28319:23-2092(+)